MFSVLVLMSCLSRVIVVSTLNVFWCVSTDELSVTCYRC